MSEFFKRLIYTRLSMNLSKKEFGELGGVSDVSQGRYEDEDPTKRRFPDVEYLLNLEKHGIDINYLLTGISSSNNLNADESLLLETFRNGNDQSKKLMLDLCRTLSGLPEQARKKDDQDPPKSGSRQKISNIKSEGGSIDIIQGDNNIKSTTHNYEAVSAKTLSDVEISLEKHKDHKKIKLEDAFQKIARPENFLKALITLGSFFVTLFFLRELSTVKAETLGEQVVLITFILFFPLTLGYTFKKEATKIITKGFDGLREKARRRILLE